MKRCSGGTYEKERKCIDCQAGQFSTEGSIQCTECDAGRFAANNASSDCTECNAQSRQYTDQSNSISCKICETGKVSTGKKCLEAPIDKDLPTLENVRVTAVPVVATNNKSLSFNYSRINITWNAFTAADHASVVSAVEIQWSNELEFPNPPKSKTMIALIDDTTSIRSKTGSITIDLVVSNSTIQFPPITTAVIYVRIRTLRQDGTPGTWSIINPKWLTAKDCSDTQFLNMSIVKHRSWDPLTFQCRPCPIGATCKGDITWNGVIATFGYWRLPSNTPPNEFVQCPFPGACLGARNNKLEGKYLNKSWDDGRWVDGIDYAKHRLKEGCNSYYGFEAGSRLCHSCRDEFRRVGLDRCSLCPQSGQNVGLLLLAVVLLITGGTIVVWMAIKDAGKAEQSEIIRKITFNFLQVSALAAGFPLHWPPALEGLFDFQGAISTAGEHILNPDCSVRGVSAADLFFAKQIGYAMTPIGLGFAIFLFWRIYAACCGVAWSDRRTVETHTIKDKMIVTLCVLLYFFWPTSLKQAFGMFSCRFVGSNRDKMYLMADFEEPCFEGRHAIYAIVVGASQILLYAIGLPLLVFVFLWRHRNELNKPVVRFRYGLFFAGFRKKKYYWECIVALRKESTVILAVFGPQLGIATLAHVALLVFMVQILVQLIGHPYDPLRLKLQILDVTSMCICWFTMWSGFFFYTPRPESQKRAIIFLTMLVVLVNTFHMCYLLYSMCSAACNENKDNVIVKRIRDRASSLNIKRVSSFNRKVVRRNTRHIQNPSSGIELTIKNSSKQKKSKKTARSSPSKKKKNKKSRPDALPNMKSNRSVSQNLRRDRLSAVHKKRQTLEMKNINVFETSSASNPLYKGGEIKENEKQTEIEIHIDEETGYKFSYNTRTEETIWMDEIDDEVEVEEEIDVDTEIQIKMDGNGDRYSWNPVTDEVAWLDEEIASDAEVVNNI